MQERATFQYKWLISHIHFFPPSANTLSSKLQQLDGQLNAKETILHEQRSKMGEKEKVITNQRTEIERLEKKSKTLEYKVRYHLNYKTYSNQSYKSKNT